MVLHFLQPAHFITFEQWFSSSDDRQSQFIWSPDRLNSGFHHQTTDRANSSDLQTCSTVVFIIRWQSQFIWSPDMLNSGFHHQMTEPIHLISRHAQQWFSSSDDRQSQFIWSPDMLNSGFHHQTTDRANSSDLQTCSTVVFIIRRQTEPIHLISRHAQQWFSSSDDRQSQFIWSPDMLNSGFHHQTTDRANSSDLQTGSTVVFIIRRQTEPIHLISRHAQQWFSSSDDRANSSDLQTGSAVVFIIRWQNQFIWSPDMLNSGFHHQMTVTAPGVHPTCNFCLHPTFFFWPWQVDVLKCVVRRDNKHNFYCILSQIRGQNHENWLWMQVKSTTIVFSHLWVVC